MKNHIDEYVRAIKRQLIKEHHFQEHPIYKGVPVGVPDDTYPVTVNGRIDYVRVVDGHLEFFNFERPSS